MSDSFDLASEFENLSKEEAGFAIIPEDTYTWLVVDAREDKSANKGTPEIKARVEVVEGKFAGHSEWIDMWYTAKSREMFARNMLALGISWDQIMELRHLDKIAAATVGAVFKGRVKHEPSDFGDRVRVNPSKFISNQNASNGAAAPSSEGTLDPFKGLLDDEEPATPAAKPVGNPEGAVDLSTVTLDDEPAAAPAAKTKQPAKVPAAAESGDEDPWA
jgi:hypothetical protein